MEFGVLRGDVIIPIVSTGTQQTGFELATISPETIDNELEVIPTNERLTEQG